MGSRPDAREAGGIGQSRSMDAIEANTDPEGYAGRILVRDGAIVVEMRGEVDVASCDRVEADVLAAERAGPGDVVLDLRRVHFMGSVGIAVLISASLRLHEAGRALVVVPGAACGRLIDLVGLRDHLILRPRP